MKITFFLLLFVLITPLSFSGDLIIQDGETVSLNNRNFFDKVEIKEGGRLSMIKFQTGILEILADDILIESGAILCSTHTNGYYEAFNKPTDGTHGGIGGGYGGKGGAPTLEQRDGPRGNLNKPNITHGALGGCGPSQTIWGAFAAGLLVLNSDVIEINGTIDFSGFPGYDWVNDPTYGPGNSYLYGGGGSSGGGILILTKQLIIGPEAYISVNGGDGGDGMGSLSCREGYPGGGGRIKIFYEEGIISESAVIEANPGNRPNFNEACGGLGGAEPGTIWIEKVESINTLLEPRDLDGNGMVDQNNIFLLQQKWHSSTTDIVPYIFPPK